MRVISPFGPKIAKLRFSSKLINKINFEVDKISANIPLAKKLDYSKKLVGQVKQEISLPKSFIKKNLDTITARSIEIPAIGTFLCSKRTKSMEKIFIENKEGTFNADPFVIEKDNKTQNETNIIIFSLKTVT